MENVPADAEDRTRSGLREIGKKMTRPFKTFSGVLIRQLSFITEPSQGRSSESADSQCHSSQALNSQRPSTMLPPGSLDTEQAQRTSDAPVPQQNDHPEAGDITPGIIPAGLESARSSLPNGARPPTPPLQGRIAIRPSEKAKGKGVFTTMDLPEKEVVLHENPWLGCNYHKYWLHSPCTAVEHWERLDDLRREQLRHNFEKLSNMPPKGLKKRQQKKLQSFVGKYSFRHDNTQATKSNLALVYLYPCLINHACEEHANCEVRVHHEEPHVITVTLKRDVHANEELLITYNEKRLYPCMDCCGSSTQKARRTLFRVVADLEQRWTQFKGGLKARFEAAPESRPNNQTEPVPHPDPTQQPGTEEPISQATTPRAST